MRSSNCALKQMLSVIIPVYNEQDYLARCIDSVLCQSHKDLEIILVDDGSTDHSGSVCDDYASRDSRIKVIHKSNGGLSDARNAGLDVITGDYVTFIDADDYVHPCFAELLLAAINDSGVQIAVCRWQELNEGSEHKPVDTTVIALRTFTQEEAINSIFYQKELTHSACSRIFKTSIFDDIRFPKGVLYEDLAVIYPIMKKVDKVALIDPPMYYYMHRKGSIITTMTLQRTQVLDHLEALETQVAEEAPQYLPAVRSRHLSACFNMLRLMPADDPQWQPIKQKCWKYVKNMRNVCMRDSQVRDKNKLAILISFLGLKALMWAINRK